jgi:hypothetical protein
MGKMMSAEHVLLLSIQAQLEDILKSPHLTRDQLLIIVKVMLDAVKEGASAPVLPVIDFNQDVILEPPVRDGTNIGVMRRVQVMFDAAEGEGRVWLSDFTDDMIAIEGIENARKLAMLLTAWVNGYKVEDLKS